MADEVDPEAAPAYAAGSDEAILEDIRVDYAYDVAAWEEIRKQAAIDVAYAANDTWNTDDAGIRGDRPMLNLDQLSQYRNQVENTVRQNKRAIKASQAGAGATEKTATHRANRIRELEYQSHAQEAYSQAFSDCLTRSYGFARIVAEYEDEETDNQVLRVKAIPNPNQVLPDSDGESTSGRDWRRCFYVVSLTHKEFRRDYPDATIRDFDGDVLAKAGAAWMSPTRVNVAEAWRVVETPNPKGYGRPKREVCMYLTNGVELLAKKGQPKKHPWKGKYIPFAACYGRVVYKGTATGDSEKMMLSYIRFARDGAKGYNWTKSTLLEKLALPVKSSLMGYKGQADNDAIALIQRATQEHIPWIEFAAQTEATGQAILPLPQYGTREPDIQADLIAAEGFQRDIQNALGHFNVTDARLGNSKVTSGLALQELKRSGDLGSYDFLDHYDDFLKFLGEQYDDLLTHYDDTPKEVMTRQPDGTPKQVVINTPTKTAPDGRKTFGPDDIDMSVGKHTITISTGPSFDSQREQVKETVLTLMGNQQLAPLVSARGVQMMDMGPDGEELAKDLEWAQPPEMRQAKQAQLQQDGKPPDPAQLQQKIAQLEGQLKELDGVAQQMDGALKGKHAEQQAKGQLVQMEIASKEKIAGMQLAATGQLQLQLQESKNAAAIAIAHIAASAKGLALEAHAAEEAQALGHAIDQADAARAHELGMATLGHQQALDAGQQQTDAAVALADQGHQQTLEVGQQQADLTPPPPDPGLL